MRATATNTQVASAVSKAKRLTSDLNYGRLALDQTIAAGRVLWPAARRQRLPESCHSWGIDWTPAQ
jgi:hypothetical protein